MSLASPRWNSSSPELDSRSAAFVRSLRELALSELGRMYVPAEGLFAFRLRRTPAGLVREGLSRRYTAIAAIGLAGEPERDSKRVLDGGLADALCGRLLADVHAAENLGDVALMLWAAALLGHGQRERAVERLRTLRPLEGARPTVELAWTLAALSLDRSDDVGELRSALAARLLEAFDPRTGMFPHVVGGEGGLRSHVACFADLVYPIQALSLYSSVCSVPSALAAAGRAAEQICRAQGRQGQWWWHYDVRTGRVLEGYPVYAVHQDAMAPLALFALREAGGPDFGENVQRGLDWLNRSPELGGASLVDEAAGLIWRKVGRREPGKLSRSLQALVSRAHSRLRIPGLDALFPPGAVDHESRPYHMGWLLHAFPRARGRRW